MASELRVEARELHKSFGVTRAVRGVSLTVAPGEAYGLVGPDGAGKTTILRMLAGVMVPDEGSVAVMGQPLATHPERARARLGYLSQRFSLYSELTVMENLRFFGEVRGVTGGRFRARAEELLAFVGLLGSSSGWQGSSRVA